MRLRPTDPIAAQVETAIRRGDVEALRCLLDQRPGLAAARIGEPGRGAKTPLAIAADWPGFFPNGAKVVAALIAAGGDPNDRGEGKDGEPGDEAPLHWAASSDDAEVAEALIEGGADINMAGGSIGTPLENAIGYGCWQVADLLVARGAAIDQLWVAAALGKMARIEAFFAADPEPTGEEINHAFWQACHGGQPRAAAYLRQRGAALNWTPDYADDLPLKVAKGGGTRWGITESWLREQGATES